MCSACRTSTRRFSVDSNAPRHMTELTGFDLEIEMPNDYSEVLLMVETVVLHMFR